MILMSFPILGEKKTYFHGLVCFLPPANTLACIIFDLCPVLNVWAMSVDLCPMLHVWTVSVDSHLMLNVWTVLIRVQCCVIDCAWTLPFYVAFLPLHLQCPLSQPQLSPAFEEGVQNASFPFLQPGLPLVFSAVDSLAS